MGRLLILVGTTLGGLAFGWGADAVGCEFLTSFLLSGLGSIIGCWIGWKVNQAYFL